MKTTNTIFAIMLSITLSGCGAGLFSSKMDEMTKENVIKQFTTDYIKLHPESIPLINKYNDCFSGKESAVEGCFAHVTKNDEEKKILQKFFDELNPYVEKEMKK